MVMPNYSLTELARDYVRTRDIVVRNKLVEEAQPFVKKIAFFIHRKTDGRILLEEMVSDGNLGLINNLDKFDPSRGLKFETYIQFPIRHYIIQGINRFGDLKRTEKIRLSAMRRFERRFVGVYEISPLYEDYKEEWVRNCWNEELFDDFYREVLNNDRSKKVANALKFRCDTDSELLEFRESLERDFSELPEKYREILRKLGEGKTPAEVAVASGISNKRVYQVRDLLKSDRFFGRTREHFGIEAA